MTANTENGTTLEQQPPCSTIGQGRIVLNFYYENGVHAVELREGPGLIVGRGEPADVKLPVRSLSRRHARFVREGDQIWVTDLASLNGVMHGSEGVQCARLERGSTVRLAAVTVVAHRLDPANGDPPEHGALARSERDASALPAAPAIDGSWQLPVACSPRMRVLEQMVRRVGRTDMPVLVMGETGVGKELVAEGIHRESERRSSVFRAVNCGAIPDSLLSSLLFGHEKGAFTGASQTSKGIFEQAQGGTVFLDEIGELSGATQAALLRVLETKRVTRLGSQRELQLDTRVIAATHRDLEAMAGAGTFRNDLLFRLNAFMLRVPPLRERIEDIPPLVGHFMRAARTKLGLPMKDFDHDAMKALLSYPWPGNVRELRNVVEHAVVMCEGTTIAACNLPEHVRGSPLRAKWEAADPSALRALTGSSLFHEGGYRRRVREYEVELIEESLRSANGNQTQAAERLKLPLRTLVHKIKTYGIRRGSEAE